MLKCANNFVREIQGITKMKISVVSGGFDPLHSGHINLLESASAHGEKLVVLLNSDEWLTRKKGRPFMPFDERALILERMHMVDYVFGVDDSDDTVTNGLETIKEAFDKQGATEYVFCNGVYVGHCKKN